MRSNSRLSCAGVNVSSVMRETPDVDVERSTSGSQRRVPGEAPLALGAGPELEQQPKLILPINGDPARGINLPDAAVYHDGGSSQGQGLVISPAQACL